MQRLDKLATNPAEHGGAALLRGTALYVLGRVAEGDAAFDAAERLLPDEPHIAEVRFSLTCAIGDLPRATAALDHLLSAFPDVARGESTDLIFRFLHALRQTGKADEADRLTVALARIGYGGDDVATRDEMAKSAATIALKAGDSDTARTLATRVTAPGTLIALLTDRRFEALWDPIAAQAGPHLERARALAVADAERNFAATPTMAARRALIAIDRQTRRYAQADRLGAEVGADAASLAALDEVGGWVVNDHALTLHSLGRRDGAEARFAALLALPIAERPWLISMLINRLELLVRDKRYAEALPHLDAADRAAASYGSGYARQLLRRLRVCTLAGLGRKAEAEAALTDTLSHAADAPGPTIDALLCTGRDDEAATRLAALLADDEHREDAIDAVQPPDTRVEEDPSLWTEGYTRIASRPVVAAALAKVGRVLPEALRPPPGPSALQ